MAPGEGALTPDEAAQAYDTARAATREFHSVYGDKTPTGAALKRGPFGGGHAVADSGVTPLYFQRGPAGAEAVQNLIDAVGQDKAQGLIRDQAAASLRYEAAQNGRINVPKWRQWLGPKGYGPALSKFPDLAAEFAKPADAQAELDRAVGEYAQQTEVHYRAWDAAMQQAERQHSDFVRQFERSALGSWLRADPDKAAGALFQGNDRVSRAQMLADRLPDGSAAREGLRRAVWDQFMRRVIPGYDAERPPEPGEVRFTPESARRAFAQNRAMLETVLRPEQMRTLQGVVDSFTRDQAIADRVRERVGSNTARDTRLIRQMEGKSSLLAIALGGGLDTTATLAGTAAEGLPGGFVAHVGFKALASIGKALREAGIDTRNELISRIYADPEFARSMFARYSPDGIQGAARRIIQALKRSPRAAVPAAVATGSEEQRRRSMP